MQVKRRIAALVRRHRAQEMGGGLQQRGEIADRAIAIEQMRFDAETAQLHLRVPAAARAGDVPTLRQQLPRQEGGAVAQAEAEQVSHEREVWSDRCTLWRTCNLPAPE